MRHIHPTVDPQLGHVSISCRGSIGDVIPDVEDPPVPPRTSMRLKEDDIESISSKLIDGGCRVVDGLVVDIVEIVDGLLSISFSLLPCENRHPEPWEQ